MWFDASFTKTQSKEIEDQAKMDTIKLSKYILIEQIGRGGYGMIYRAQDSVLEVERAIKVLHPELAADPDFIERFRREAKISARLEHPNIVPVYDIAQVEGRTFLAMKYMTEGSLKELLRKEGRLSYQCALEIMEQICAALGYAYQQPEQLIHRDIKPSNILFDENGVARLSDFGFAKALASTDAASLSASGAMIGTPQYMAPEIWRGKGATSATDVYSLACVFYEMLTGEMLFYGETPPDIMTKHMLDGPQFPKQWGEGIPEGIEKILNRALSRRLNERYQNAIEFIAELRELAHEIESETIIDEQLKQESEFSVDEKENKLIPTSVELKSTINDAETHDESNHERINKRQESTKQDRVYEKVVENYIIKKKMLPWFLVGVGLVVILIGIAIFLVNRPKVNDLGEEDIDSSLEIAIQRVFTKVPMAWIPAGTFVMGTNNGLSDEGPAHEVYLDGFLIDIYEVTNEEFVKFLNDKSEQGIINEEWYKYYSDNAHIQLSNEKWLVEEGYQDHPVTEVSWYGAQAYCEWRGARLPTEAEWEKSARGKLDDKMYPWGDEDPICEAGKNNGAQSADCGGGSVPVGSFTPNFYGLYDMAGNVLEGVQDYYDVNYYEKSSQKNPTGPTLGISRALRGGSWNDEVIFINVHNRYKNYPYITFYDIGFRCADSP